jgi:hypothetical protein
MNLDEFVKRGDVRVASKDEGLIRSLLSNVRRESQYLNTLELTELSSQTKLIRHYDMLRMTLEALCSTKGLKLYSHEAITKFLELIDEMEISKNFERMRVLRNKINYYGQEIQLNEARQYIEDIKNIVDYLINKYLGEFK